MTGVQTETGVLADVDPDSQVAQEEIFGPVLTVTPYDTDDEAIAIAYDTIYGLSGEVSSGDVDRALEVAKRMHYITNIESDVTGDTARVRAMFYNPMQLPGMSEPSYCGGYYHHDLVRTPDGWRSRSLREENVWFVNSPAGASQTHL
jgi:hypothetical protein